MKKILVTGKNGSVSNAFKEYMVNNFCDHYSVKTMSLRDNEWERIDFSQYDAIYHCAGIVKSNETGYDEFKKVNVDLTEKLFHIASQQGLKQFIFLSSMAVYGAVDSNCKDGGIINENTVPKAPTLYGKSKLEAENKLLLNCENKTKIAIIRAPSIVGKGTEKYFDMYYRLLDLPVFPLMFKECKRSIIYIDCLSELVRLIIDSKCEGMFYPQNQPVFSTSEFLKEIKKTSKNKAILITIPNPLQFNLKKFDKIFGNICYTNQISNSFDNKYNIVDTKTAIYYTIKEED